MARTMLLALGTLALAQSLGHADGARRRAHRRGSPFASSVFGHSDPFADFFGDSALFGGSPVAAASKLFPGSSSPLDAAFAGSSALFPQLGGGAFGRNGGFPTAAWVAGSPSNSKGSIISSSNNNGRSRRGVLGALEDVFNVANGLVAPSTASSSTSSSAASGLVAADPLSQMQVSAPPPARTYDAHTDDTSGDLVIEVSAPQATGTSFDIEVDDARRTLRVKEHWDRSESHTTPSGARTSSHSSGAFEKAWRVPATVTLDAITAEWDDEGSKLVVRMPVDHTQNMLIEHDTDGSKSAVAPKRRTSTSSSMATSQQKQQPAAAAAATADGAATCSPEQARQQEEYEQRMQQKYEQQLREYERRRAEHEKQQAEAAERERQEREEYAQRLDAHRRRQQEQQQKEQKAAEARQRAQRQAAADAKQAIRDARARRRQEQLRELQKQQQLQQQQKQQRGREEPVCAAGARVQAVYAPNGQFYDAVVRAVDMASGRVAVAWADGDTDHTVIPALAQFLRGCRLPAVDRTAATGTPQQQEEDAARGVPATRKIVTDEQREERLRRQLEPETVGRNGGAAAHGAAGIDVVDDDDEDDEFEVIEEWFTDDDLEGVEKDDDASSGYFMFGEFHPY